MIRALISDLGNVLLHFDHSIIAERLERDFPGRHRSREQDARFWALMHAFERGTVETHEFLASIGDLLGVGRALDNDAFRVLWGDIFWLNDEYLALLRALKSRLKLVLLSNTNPLHIDFVKERFPTLLSVFDATVYSFEAGCSKPDPAIFHRALAAADVTPEEAVYFDDIASYSDAASDLGMHGHQYVSVQGAREVLALHHIETTVSTP